jgi:ATP-binding cassette, subfamily C (CFTR/MRP), member 1
MPQAGGPGGANKKKGGKLVDINVEVKKGSLTVVVGPVGSGKSSFLNALLGDMRRDGGSVSITGRMAYCQQSAWIKNDTVRGNITFGKPFDR